MSEQNMFFTTGKIDISLFGRLNDNEKYKVEAILKIVDGIKLKYAEQIILSANEQLKDRLTFNYESTLP